MKMGIIQKRKIFDAGVAGSIESEGKNTSIFKPGDIVKGGLASFLENGCIKPVMLKQEIQWQIRILFLTFANNHGTEEIQGRKNQILKCKAVMIYLYPAIPGKYLSGLFYLIIFPPFFFSFSAS
jgi:hypothetical protein